MLVFVALALAAPLIRFAIAQLKAGQIKNWLGGRQGDCEVLAGDSTFAAQVSRFVQQEQNAELSKSILNHFDKLRSSYGYTKIMEALRDSH